MSRRPLMKPIYRTYRVAMDQLPVYDYIGERYSRGRQADVRIAALLEQALAGASSVLNVGAGSGSYEPRDRHVVAVEPSTVMIAQRNTGAAPVVRAVAEALPFQDRAFDAAMGVLTIHHWSDLGRGLAEMRRVARDRVVLFTRDPQAVQSWWLYDYFPATARLEASRETRFDELIEMLGGDVEVTPVPIPADCTDGFNAAYWQRPQAYLDPNIWRPMSALALIPNIDRNTGMQRLRTDLANGTWHHRWGHLLTLDELDLGYRILIAHT
jgi:SAM-dependent methyltransferase